MCIVSVVSVEFTLVNGVVCLRTNQLAPFLLMLRMGNNSYELRKNSTDHLTLEIDSWGRNLPSIFFPRPRNIVLGQERCFTCL